MGVVLVYPGQRGEPVALVDVLREAHESVRAYVDAEIKLRQTNKAPLLDEGNGETLTPLGEYEHDPAIDGVTVTMQIVSDAQRRSWDVAYAGAVKRYQTAADDVARVAADEDAWRIMGEVVGGVVVKIDGVDGLKGSVVEASDALRAAGLLSPLFRACRHFMGLPRPKALRCGQPQR